MPSRCVIHECSNKSNPKEGISLHISPLNKRLLARWKAFISLHRGNFNPEDRFVVCSVHFKEECFSRRIHQEGSRRLLLPESVPMIWIKTKAQTSERDHRMVSSMQLFDVSVLVLYLTTKTSYKFLKLWR